MCRLVAPLVLLTLVLAPAAGTAVGTSPRESVEELARATREYQEALARLLTLQEAGRKRADAEVVRLRDLAAKDLIARRDVAEAEERAAALARTAAETRQEIVRAETVVVEARASVVVAAAPPAPGEERRTPEHIAFGGGGPWSLASLPVLERFFTDRFGRPLPISAYGQTRTHDELGFDHRDAIDVAVHPDTAEGRALLAYLKAARIPFIAFRAAERGVATGAHVHIGEPSPRRPTAPAAGRTTERSSAK